MSKIQELKDKIVQLRELYKDEDTHPDAKALIFQYEKSVNEISNRSAYLEMAMTQALLKDANEQIKLINDRLLKDEILSVDERGRLLAERKAFMWYVTFLDPNIEKKVEGLLNVVNYNLGVDEQV